VAPGGTDDASGVPRPQGAGRRGSRTREETDRINGLIAQHRQSVCRYVRRMGMTPQDADDVAQRVFLIAMQKLDTIQRGHEQAFLLATAANVVHTTRRSFARRRAMMSDTVTSTVSERTTGQAVTTPENELAEQDERRILAEILNEIPEQERVVFVLSELHEMASAVIAEALAIPRGTVASRLRRARALFVNLAKQRQKLQPSIEIVISCSTSGDKPVDDRD
jgi:RNA polymerase sigma-70 factor (ECF subfamily)